jgi:flagellar biosynthesis/type III secretory pathway chaperone
MDISAIHTHFTATLELSERLLALLQTEFKTLKSNKIEDIQTLLDEKEQVTQALKKHQNDLMQLCQCENKPDSFKSFIASTQALTDISSKLKTSLQAGNDQNQSNALLLQKSAIRNRVLQTIIRGSNESTYGSQGYNSKDSSGQLITKA